MKRIISLLLVFAMLLPNFTFLAEAKTLQTGDEIKLQEETDAVLLEDGKTLAGGDTSYLKISMEKYGETITASSEHSAEVSVLEYTQWQLSARFVRVDEGEIVEDKDVTIDCDWTVTDTTGETLSVTSYGTVSAKKASDVGYVVTASYKGIAIENVDGVSQEVMKTFTSSMDFFVTKLTVEPEDAEALRCYALTYLANYEWEDMMSYQGKTVSDWIEDIQELDYGTAAPTTKGYLYPGGYEGSAKVFHFLSAAAGDYTIETCANSSDMEVRAVVFHNEYEQYLAYAFSNLERDKLYAEQFAAEENRGMRRSAIMAYCDYDHESEYFQQGYKIYKDVVDDSKDTKLVGQFFGGTLAKHIAYITGCKSVSFNAPSPIQYTILYDFDKLCQNYSIDRQISYNNPMYETASTAYAVEPGYKVYSLLPIMVNYDYSSERILFRKQSSEFKREQTLWNRDAYLGSDGIDYDITIKEDEVSKLVWGADAIVFGGASDDKVTWNVDWGKILGKEISGFIGDEAKEGMLGFDKFDVIAEVIYGAKKAQWISIAKDVLEVGKDIALGYSMIDCNYIVLGKNYDLAYGPTNKTRYIYSLGDGYDTYHIKNSTSFYFLGCEEADVQYYIKPSNPTTLFVSIDGVEQIEIDFSYDFFVGTLSLYKGNPFDPDNVTSIGAITPTTMCHAYYQSACPVDMQVYDANGELALELLDGAEHYEETEYGIFGVTLENGEYVKRALLYDGSYNIQLRGVGDGTMQYLMVKFGEEDDGQYCAIENIPVAEGATYHASDNLDDYILAVDRDADGTIDSKVTFDTTIAFPEETVQVSYGMQKQLTPEIRTSSMEKGCYWLSADEDIVAVDNEGLLTAVGVGETVVYAIANDGSGAYAQCTVTVPEETLSAENFTVTGMKQAYDYTGDVIDVQLSVSYGCLPLLQDVHYTASFSELIEPGKATLTITGINDYSGTKEISYEIISPKEPETVEEKVDWIAAKCRAEGITDEWEIALWLHDWLVYNANYDYTYTYFHPNGVLLEGKGVCQSYSEAYALLLDEFSIENQIIIADYEMDHSWNLVKLDGEWCHIDCTWDDPGTGGGENYQYFGMNDSLIARDHQWPSGYPASTSKMNYYFVRNSENLVKTREEMENLFASLAEAKTYAFECYYVGEEEGFHILEEFANWWKENDWKYGLESYHASGYEWMMEVSISYTDPWEKPSESEGLLKCPDFTLRGPSGTYPLSNYSQNGMVLIIGSAIMEEITPLLQSMSSYTADLKAKGVPLFVNEVIYYDCDEYDYNKLPDLRPYQWSYPDFEFTYWDPDLEYSLMQLAEGDYWYDREYQYVFVLNKNAEIVYHAAGDVVNVKTLIAKANEVATGKPIPEPEPVDERYHGSAFRYTGSKSDLAKEMGKQLDARKKRIAIYDGSWTGDVWYWEKDELLALMLTICQEYKEKEKIDIQVKEYQNMLVDIGCLRNVSVEVTYPALCREPDVSISSSGGRPLVKWESVNGAEEYKVYRSTSKSKNFSCIGTTEKTSYTDKEAVLGKTYYYKVKAVDADGSVSGYSNVVSKKAVLPKPEVDTENVASSGKIKVSWKENGEAEQYYVYRATSKSGEYTKVKSTTGTSYTDKNTTAGKTYYYKVKAIHEDSAANSSYSSVVSRMCDLPYPEITASKVSSSGKIKVNWEKVDGAEKYRVYRADSEDGEYSKLEDTTKTSYTDSSAEAGKLYYYKVKALHKNSNANSAYSKPANALCVLAKPVITVKPSQKGVLVSWEALTGAASYEVYRSVGEAGDYEKLADVAEAAFEDTGTELGVSYSYQVKAIHENAEANSGKSTAVSCTRTLAQPKLSVSGVAATGKNRLSWEVVEGTKVYRLYRSTSKSSGYKKLAELSQEETGYTDTGAKAGTKYYYKLKAIHENSAANSAYSEIKSRICDLPQPEITAKKVTSSGKIKVSWGAIEGTKEYRVYRANSEDGEFSRIATVASSKKSYTDTSAEAGKTYYYKVKAMHKTSDANSAYSGIVSAFCVLGQPEISVSGVSSTGKNKVTWEAMKNVATYEIWRSDSKNGEYILLGTAKGSAESYTDKSAEAGKAYFYKVNALHENPEANGKESEVVSRTCDLPRPDVTVKLKSNGDPKLSWEKIEGAEKYYVYRATSSSGEYKKIKTTTSASYTDTSAKAGKTYYYKVKAVHENSSANSAYSSVDKIKAK